MSVVIDGEIEMLAALANHGLEAKLRCLEVQQRRLDAERALVLAEVDRRGHGRVDGFTSLAAWCRGTLGWSRRECRARGQLMRLIGAYPDVAEDLLDGSLSVANAETLAAAWANPRVRDRFGEFIGEFLHQGTRMEHDDFRLVVESFVALADADGAHRDRDHDHRNRSAHFGEFHGVGTLVARWGDMDTAMNKQIFDRFVQAEWDADWALCVAEHGDAACAALMTRTDAQRRADALSAIVRRAGASVQPKGVKVVTNVHIDWQNWSDLMAWAGLFPDRVRDPFEAADTPVTQWRCHTGDGGVVDPIAVLRASLEGYVRFVVLSRDGVPIHWGRERRLFEGAARDAVMSLSPRCTHPGCRVPASRSQADHLIPWSEGGRTDPDNGGPRCPHHNRWRTRGYRATHDRFGWHTYRPDGTEIC